MVLFQRARSAQQTRRRFCAVCDAALISSRRDAKFCSSACRQACYRARKAAKATEARKRADWAAAMIG
jgi:hypothetical protein